MHRDKNFDYEPRSTTSTLTSAKIQPEKTNLISTSQGINNQYKGTVANITCNYDPCCEHQM